MSTPQYVLLNETSLEVVRGLWLKFSPQLLTAVGDTSSGVWRLAFAADLLPRTHWHLSASYYRDKSRTSHLVSHVLLGQIHLYL